MNREERLSLADSKTAKKKQLKQWPKFIEDVYKVNQQFLGYPQGQAALRRSLSQANVHSNRIREASAAYFFQLKTLWLKQIVLEQQSDDQVLDLQQRESHANALPGERNQ